METTLLFSVLIPAYKGANIIGQTLRSILSQSYQHFEIIVQDDASGDDIEKTVNEIGDERIKLFKNEKNLGYPCNLDSLSHRAGGEIVYLMGQDDILDVNALQNTANAFNSSPEIGGVARPYYWFDRDINMPVRATAQINPEKDELITINSPFEKIVTLIDVAGQLSGLAYRRSFIDRPFHPSIFPSHVYPFISILLKHPIVFLKDYNLAVRIGSSQCRHVSSIYNESPLQSWIDFCRDVFKDDKNALLREYIIKNYVAKNFLGLIQIRNYSTYANLFREIGLLIKYRPLNLLNAKFWFFSLGCLIVPPRLLIPLVDWYKNSVMSKRLQNIKINYKI